MHFESSQPADPNEAQDFDSMFRKHFDSVLRQLKETNLGYPYKAMVHLAQMGIVMTPLEFADFWNSMSSRQITDLCTYVARNS
jgi:hypothetical protein